MIRSMVGAAVMRHGDLRSMRTHMRGCMPGGCKQLRVCVCLGPSVTQPVQGVTGPSCGPSSTTTVEPIDSPTTPTHTHTHTHAHAHTHTHTHTEDPELKERSPACHMAMRVGRRLMGRTWKEGRSRSNEGVSE
eukprot:GHVU01152606.1.p1 GENE.GHVU01152606.1~~GHVU01152606.1.p1  ORF type:complete len:133 (+),score=10.94 GHVU01152606.1:107-505(+)